MVDLDLEKHQSGLLAVLLQHCHSADWQKVTSPLFLVLLLVLVALFVCYTECIEIKTTVSQQTTVFMSKFGFCMAVIIFLCGKLTQKIQSANWHLSLICLYSATCMLVLISKLLSDILSWTVTVKQQLMWYHLNSTKLGWHWSRNIHILTWNQTLALLYLAFFDFLFGQYSLDHVSQALSCVL